MSVPNDGARDIELLLKGAPDAHIGSPAAEDSCLQAMQIRITHDTVSEMRNSCAAGRPVTIGFGKHAVGLHERITIGAKDADTGWSCRLCDMDHPHILCRSTQPLTDPRFTMQELQKATPGSKSWLLPDWSHTIFRCRVHQMGRKMRIPPPTKPSAR